MNRAAVDPGAARMLFVVDARNGFERRLLLDLVRARFGLGPDDPLDWVGLSLADGDSSAGIAALAQKLAGDDARLVAPVRAAWRSGRDDGPRPLRWRELAMGAPGSLRARLRHWRDPRSIACVVGEPASIAELAERFARQVAPASRAEPEAFAGFVARQAAITLDAEERGLQGSRYKIPRFVAKSIADSAAFQDEMRALAAELGRPPGAVTGEARGYLRELVTRPGRLWIDLRARFDRFMMSQGYEGLRQDDDDVAALRETLRRHPTLVLFTHKTYVDGTAPTLYFYDNDLPMPHTIGGINMAFLGLGTLYRRSGTIFIRRSFQENRVYKAVLRNYLAYLLAKRFPMSWAFEGTRSRLGKLMPPRYGLLKYVLEAAHDEAIENIHIVPFVTSFDLIRDVDEYALEQRGRAKKPESAIWFLGYLRSLRRPMGRMRVDLGRPVVVAQAPPPGDRLALAKIAFEVALQANRATPITVSALTALVLLGSAPRGSTEAELATVMAMLTQWARARGIRLADEFVGMDRNALLAMADKLVENGMIVREGEGGATVYAIEPAKHASAGYYRNTIVHHFLDKAIIELALLRAEEEGAGDRVACFWAEAERLRNLLKFEFFFPARDGFNAGLAAELDRLDDRWSERLAHGGGELRTLIGKLHPLVGHSALLPFVEAYLLVFEQLARLGPGEDLDPRAGVERCLDEARRAYLLRRISSQASIGKILFENGFKLAENLQLAGPGDPERIARRRAMVAQLGALLRRMERMRLDAQAWLEATTAKGSGA